MLFAPSLGTTRGAPSSPRFCFCGQGGVAQTHTRHPNVQPDVVILSDRSAAKGVEGSAVALREFPSARPWGAPSLPRLCCCGQGGIAQAHTRHPNVQPNVVILSDRSAAKGVEGSAVALREFPSARPWGAPSLPRFCFCGQGGVAQTSARNCHPERPKRSEGRRRICGCSSRISLGTTMGCPILAALLFLRPGWGSTDPHPPSERSTRRCHPERPKRSEGRRRICGCSSPPSSTTKMGCPILAAPLFLRLGWGSTNPICRVLYKTSADRSGIHPRLPQTAALLKQKSTRRSRA